MSAFLLRSLALATVWIGAQDGTQAGREDARPQDESSSNESQEQVASDGAGDESEDEERRSVEIESFSQLETLLGELQLAHPDWLELRSLGQSSGGRSILLAVLGKKTSGDPDARPGVLYLPRLSDATARQAGLHYELIRTLVQGTANPVEPESPDGGEGPDQTERGGDEQIRDLLSSFTLYVLPAPAPDRLGAQGEAPAIDLDRDFPIDWSPWSDAGRVGPYPLSTLETQALAPFLHWRSNVSAIYCTSDRAPVLERAARTDSVPKSSLGTLRNVVRELSELGADEPAIFGLETLGVGPGTLARYAEAGLGLWYFEQAPSSPALAAEFASSELLREESARIAAGTTIERARTLSRALPLLVLSDPEVTKLGENQWRVDVVVRNVGQFSTGGISAEREAGVRLVLTGESVLVNATMMRGEGESSFGSIQIDRPEVDLGHLAGREARIVRLIVRAEAESVIELRARSQRAGEALRRKTLRFVGDD